MKTLKFDLPKEYISPEATEEIFTSEGVLCSSGTLEKFDPVEDEDGWDF